MPVCVWGEGVFKTTMELELVFKTTMHLCKFKLTLP